MRRAILVLLAAGGLAALGAMPAEAVGTRYPFCIQGDDQPGLSNCTFTSYMSNVRPQLPDAACGASPIPIMPVTATPHPMPAAAVRCRRPIRAIPDTEPVLRIDRRRRRRPFAGAEHSARERYLTGPPRGLSVTA